MNNKTPQFAGLTALIPLLFSSAAVASPLAIESRLEMFVDRYLVESLKGGAHLVLHEPVDEGPVLYFDKPWEGPLSAYATVIQDGDLFRLYYRGLATAGGDYTDAETTCYAESHDGITWTKPDLGLFEVHGTSENNVILAGKSPYSHNFSPFLDTRPDAPAEERFKALAGSHTTSLAAFVSPDGIRWRKLQEEPVIRDEGWVFDSQNLAFWSEAEELYVAYYRKVIDRIRTIARTTSKDFINWTEPVLVTYSDTGSTTPSHQLYTNQTSPYFRAPHIYIATPARFMHGRQVLTAEEARAIGVHPRYFNDTSDAVFMTSRGGYLYDRTFMGALIKPGVGAANWVSRANFPALNVVQTGETEMSIYVNRHYAQATAHLRRYSWRLDGFASVRAPYEGGELLTHPLVFEGDRLLLNFATSAAGSIRVEVQNASGRPLPGFTLAEAREVIGNEIERQVRWNDSPGLGSLAGKPVRLRFVMKDADLFAMRFASETESTPPGAGTTSAASCERIGGAVIYDFNPDTRLGGEVFGTVVADFENDHPGRNSHGGPLALQYPNGDLVAFHTNTSGHNVDGWTEYAVSRDGGRTWDKYNRFQYSYEAYGDDPNTTAWVEAGMVTPNGTIVLFITHFENRVRAGSGIMRSRDNGETWTEYQPLDGDFFAYPADAAVSGDTLYVLFDCGRENRHVLYVSTDDGDTWEKRSVLPLGNEKWYGTLCVMADGRLLAAAYDSADEHHLFYCISDDGGHAWTEQKHSYLDRRIRKPMMAQINGRYYLHGRSGHSGEGSRQFVLYQSDDGENWSEGIIISTRRGLDAYSNNTVIRRKDGSPRELMVIHSITYAGENTNTYAFFIRPDAGAGASE